MSHTESVRPIPCASCGRAGRSLSTMFEVMIVVVSSPKGCFPVKTLGSIQISDRPSVPPSQYQRGQDTGTNLYHNHPKSKHICLPCDCIGSPDNLWHGPCRSEFIDLRCEAHSTNDRSELKIRQTSVAAVINENIGLAKGYRSDSERVEENAHPFQVSVYGVVRVKIVKTFGYVQQLGRITLSIKCNYGERPTRLIRFVSGFFSMNSTRVLFGIHSEMICKGFVVTPMKGTTLGCLNLFQVTASLKNDYKTHNFLEQMR